MHTIEIAQPEGPPKAVPLGARLELGADCGLPPGALLLEFRSGLVVATAGAAPVEVGGQALSRGERRVVRAGEALSVAGRAVALREAAAQSGTQALAREVLKASASRPPGALGPELIWLNGPELGKRVRLTAEATFLGRADGCAGRLSDPQASRMHAKLVRTPQGFQLVDLMSANGISVDGARVQGALPLRGGETLRVGETLLGFVSAEPQRPATPPPPTPAPVAAPPEPPPPAEPVAPPRPKARRLAAAEAALLGVAGFALAGGGAAVWWALR